MQKIVDQKKIINYKTNKQQNKQNLMGYKSCINSEFKNRFKAEFQAEHFFIEIWLKKKFCA